MNVSADREGLELLRQQIEILLSGQDSHVHLMTESWGGQGLDEGDAREGEVLVQAVNIGLVTPSAHDSG